VITAAALAAMLAVATPGELPPYAGAYQPQTKDERGLWMQSDEEERIVRDSAFVIRDAALNAYLRDVLCRAVGTARCEGVRIHIVRDAAFNANMSPNGFMRVFTGALLRIRDEAELASMLGHEFAHFELRHTLVGFKQERHAHNLAIWAGLLGGGSAIGVQLALIGSTYEFSRAQETEADMLSSRFLEVAGFDRQCAADLWQRIADETDETARGRRQRSQRYDPVGFLATHPTNLTRMRYLAAAAADQPSGRRTGQEAYRAAMKPWRALLLADQLKRNDFAGTEYLLGQLAQDGWTEELLFARGELYRLRRHPRDLVAAARFYTDAIALDPKHAESQRGLGLALLRSGEVERGRLALRRYLELVPAASDAPMLATLLS